MIVFGKTREPKTASATSTYPAVITCVEEKASDVEGGLVKLSFYCPATMDGHPMENAYCGSNIVEAPMYPHNGAEKYDFQVGGVICISYEDGNLNTPQFVRYVKVTDDTIGHNKRIIDGSYIPADESLHVDYTRYGLDILKSPRLQKAVSLMPAVRKSASNNNKDSCYTFVRGANNFLVQDRAYTKVGLYGAELLCTEFPDAGTSGWDFASYISESKFKLATQHSLIEILSYLVTDSSGVSTVKPEKIIDVFKQSCITDVTMINTSSHPLATYLFVVLSGLPHTLSDFESQAPKLYPSANKEAYNSEILSVSVNKTYKGYELENELSEFYKKEDWTVKYKSVWNNFVTIYGEELKKCYTCILNDNMVSLSTKYNLQKWDNVMFAIMSVISTAWPILENTITDTTQYVDDDDNLKKFFSTLDGYLTNNKPVTEYNASIIKNIGDGYADAYIHLLTKDWGHTSEAVPKDMKSTISKDIQLGIKAIIDDWDNIGTILAKDITSDGEVPTGGNANDWHIWCYLMLYIKNAYGVAGLMGNMYYESAMKSNNLQNTYENSLGMTDAEYTKAVDNGSYTKNKFINDWAGYGLIQWTDPTRKQRLYKGTVEKGVSISDVDAQLAVVIDELQNHYKSTYDTLTSAKSVKEASTYVLKHFEVPANTGSTVQAERADKGEYYYRLYADTATGGWGSGDFICPLNKGYRVSCEYHGYTGHGGIDLATSVGTPVFASRSGTVKTVKTIVDHNTYGNGGSYGKYIVIDHGSGFTTYYAHLSEFNISQGARVTQGQQIAKSGNTGNSSGPHLHFEIRKNNSTQNPRDYVKF